MAEYISRVSDKVKIYKALPLSIWQLRDVLINKMQIADFLEIFNTNDDFELKVFECGSNDLYDFHLTDWSAEDVSDYLIDENIICDALSRYFDIDVKYVQPYAIDCVYVMFEDRKKLPIVEGQEVIRCKNCNFYDIGGCTCNLYQRYSNPYYFCSNGMDRNFGMEDNNE